VAEANDSKIFCQGRGEVSSPVNLPENKLPGTFIVTPKEKKEKG
jgi:hypothetical protein